MKRKYELNDEQYEYANEWKARHFETCVGIYNFELIFDTIDVNVPIIKCAECNQKCYLDDDISEKELAEIGSKKLFSEKDDPIFIGSRIAESQKEQLHDRLSYAFSMLSGRQQNGGMGSEYSDKEEKESEQAIIDVIDDVIIAFGLKNREQIWK
jgi:hypothetical protein